MKSQGVEDVATQFVDLSFKYDDWQKVETLPAEEVAVLLDVVLAAGFEVEKVVPGRITGNLRDQDRDIAGTYTINILCPFKVVGQGKNYSFATGWLDCMLQRSVDGRHLNESREKIIEAIVEQIKRSVPLEPIRLNREGDFLGECPPPPSSYLVDHTRDKDNIGSCVGVHKYCNGFMDRMQTTETRFALVCRKCYLRALFPNEAQTYGELRQFFG